MSAQSVTSKVRWVDSLRSLTVPNQAVAIVDRTLPPSLLNGAKAAFPLSILVLPGEGLKTFSALEKLAVEVLKKPIDRRVTLVAVGGGSIGDAVGFLASILWRGVGLIQVPTTLLAMADSAHGGKTALNLSFAKNQVGTFYPAREIWIVRSILNSLPQPLVEEGLAEIVKAGLLQERHFLQVWMRKELSALPIEWALRRAIEVKQGIVRRDPVETKGLRDVLNLGHTLGHALERTTSLPHGRSVAWGLASSLVLSRDAGLKEWQEILYWIYPLLKAPKRWPTEESLVRAMSFDKKKRKKKLRSILLQRPGKPIIVENLSAKDWVSALGQVRRLSHV